ncbi:hypothetical protein [Kribbella alba]
MDCDGPERGAQLAARLPEAAHSPIEIRLIP